MISIFSRLVAVYSLFTRENNMCVCVFYEMVLTKIFVYRPYMALAPTCRPQKTYSRLLQVNFFIF